MLAFTFQPYFALYVKEKFPFTGCPSSETTRYATRYFPFFKREMRATFALFPYTWIFWADHIFLLESVTVIRFVRCPSNTIKDSLKVNSTVPGSTEITEFFAGALETNCEWAEAESGVNVSRRDKSNPEILTLLFTMTGYLFLCFFSYLQAESHRDPGNTSDRAEILSICQITS